MTPRYFRNGAAFRAWLEQHHATTRELTLGFYKRASAKKGITYAEAMDEALAFGWIDGVLHRVDDERHTLRFTPRRSGSTWSAINIRKARALIKRGRMTPAGLAAFRAMTPANTGKYSYENRPQDLPAPLVRRVKANRAAWTSFRAQPPGYRRRATWFVVSAKKEETRLKRLDILIAMSAGGQRLDAMTPPSRSVRLQAGRR